MVSMSFYALYAAKTSRLWFRVDQFLSAHQHSTISPSYSFTSSREATLPDTFKTPWVVIHTFSDL